MLNCWILLEIHLLVRDPLLTLVQELHLVPERVGQSEELPQLRPGLHDGLDGGAEIEDGLQTAGGDGDDVVEALVDVPVDPVEDVEAAVEAENEEIHADDRLRLACPQDEEELGNQDDALEVDGEGPENLHDGELVVEDESQDGAGDQQEGQPELVVIIFVRRLNDQIRFY